MKNKKGDLSLSVNAIVVMVIAFVVLGLALTFTKIIFKGGQDQLERAIGVPKFEQEATSSNPITIPDNVNLGVGKTSLLTFQFYNKGSSTLENVTMQIISCQSSETTKELEATIVPSMVSPEADRVGASEVYEFKTVLKANGVTQGLYICKIGAVDGTGTIKQEKTFFLNVAS